MRFLQPLFLFFKKKQAKSKCFIPIVNKNLTTGGLQHFAIGKTQNDTLVPIKYFGENKR